MLNVFADNDRAYKESYLKENKNKMFKTLQQYKGYYTINNKYFFVLVYRI